MRLAFLRLRKYQLNLSLALRDCEHDLRRWILAELADHRRVSVTVSAVHQARGERESAR
jgi:hypothetical protein